MVRGLAVMRLLSTTVADHPAAPVKSSLTPDDLDGSGQHVVVERLHNFGTETNGATLAVDVWRLWVANQPLVANIDPAIEALADDQVESFLGGIERQQLLLDDGQIRMHEKAAIESGNRGIDRQWCDEHCHAPGRTTAGDSKTDAVVVQAVHGLERALGQHLVARHQRTVNVGEQQRYFF